MKESEVQAKCVEILRGEGWFTCINSSDKRQRKQQRGLPDIFAFKYDHTLLIECKAAGGRLRPSQQAFWEGIRPHCGRHLDYLVVDDPIQLEAWLVGRQG